MPVFILSSQDTIVSSPNLLYQDGYICSQAESSINKHSWALSFKGKQLQRDAFTCKTVHKVMLIASYSFETLLTSLRQLLLPSTTIYISDVKKKKKIRPASQLTRAWSFLFLIAQWKMFFTGVLMILM